ncbi:MAG: ATP-binding protein [Spirosomaceae bacterium]|nr:ATP-binding protein [Spirosomataceae bacterium]
MNNFAELSVELIEEILPASPQTPEGDFKNGIKAPFGGLGADWVPQEAPFGGWGAFFDDLRLNLQKINHHGKRASSIVKGMLEHSRTSTGKKEPADLNKLADEYLRLSYHGLRAKDKSFQADYELITDESLPLINVVPQDIGRVLLNLINNAFQSPLTPEGGTKKVTVKTFKIEANEKAPFGGLGASVSDNGSGIPDDILPKIFQPFFTTKPTGQGTGLGLSLAYDIITKGHGGTIECESVEGEGTTFVVKLPIS